MRPQVQAQRHGASDGGQGAQEWLQNASAPPDRGQGRFLAEASGVLRAGLRTAAWVSDDNTGGRHKGRSGVCTQIGNGHFAWFATTTSKSRLNFLELLRAGHGDYAINSEALDNMRGCNLAGPVSAQLAGHRCKRFANQ